VKANHEYIRIAFHFTLKYFIFGRMMVENDKNVQKFLNEKFVVFDR